MASHLSLIFKEALKFVLSDVVILALLIALPQIATILPSLMKR